MAKITERKKILWHDRGAMAWLVLAISFGLFLFVPIFIDYASLHYTRRVAKTGADAGSLAAAIEYADGLSLDTGSHWWDSTLHIPGLTPIIWATACTCIDEWTLKKYFILGVYYARLLVVGNLDSIGEDMADEYANRNGTQMTHYSAAVPFLGYALPRVKFVEFIPMLPVGVEVGVQRQAPLIYRDIYGGGAFMVPGQSIAEAYLDEVDSGAQLCVGLCRPWIGAVPTYDFHWKVRLVQ